MREFLEQTSVACMVPEPVCQVGDYELDLARCCYFGWVNALSLGMNFWQQQILDKWHMLGSAFPADD